MVLVYICLYITLCHAQSLAKVLGRPMRFSSVVLKANQVWHAVPTSFICRGLYLAGSYDPLSESPV